MPAITVESKRPDWESKLSPGTVTISVTDFGFKKDIEAWCRKTKNTLVSLAEETGVITAVIKKG